MSLLQTDLEARGYNYTEKDINTQKIISWIDGMYATLSDEKRKDFMEKFIDILADAEDSLWNLKESMKNSILSKTQVLVDKLKANIENNEVYELRKKLLDVAGIDANPSRNGIASQALLAAIDFFITSLGDMAVDVYKVVDKKWALYLLGEIKNTLLSGDTWQAIWKEVLKWLGNLIFDWNTSADDFVYKKVTELLILTWFAAIVKSTAKRIIKTATKIGTKNVIKSSWSTLKTLNW